MLLFFFVALVHGYCVSTVFTPPTLSQNFTVPIQFVNSTSSFTDFGCAGGPTILAGESINFVALGCPCANASILFVAQTFGPGSFSCANAIPPATTNIVICTAQSTFTIPVDIGFSTLYQATMPNCGCECPDPYVSGPVGNSSLVFSMAYGSTSIGNACTSVCVAPWASNGTYFNNPCQGTE